MKTVSLIPVILAFCFEVSAWPFEMRIEEECLLNVVGATVLHGGNTVIALAGPFEDPLIVVLDPEGGVIRSTRILQKGGGSRAYESGGILVPSGDGFAAAFHSEPRATGIDTDVAVVRISGSGEELWTFTLGLDDELNWMCTDMIACSDGGFLVTGCPGTMIPEGYAFKLSSDGDLEWVTQTDAVGAYLLSAIELPDGSFLGLADDGSGEFLLQPISESGEILSGCRINTEGVSCRGIYYLNGAIWLSSAPGGATADAFRLDADFNIDRAVSAVFTEGFTVLYLDMDLNGFLAAGELSGDGSVALVGWDGLVLRQETFDAGGRELFSGALNSGYGIMGYGTSTYPAGFSFSVIAQHWD